jgi:hypothetical protein
LDKQRHRRLEARANRQESLRKQGTVEKTIDLPQPKVLQKVEKIIVKKNELPKVAEVVRRGPGRPPKAISESNKKDKKVISGVKKLAPVSTKGKR